MRPGRIARWATWCAALLVLCVTFSVLHIAASHSAAQRDCSTCKALSAPALAHTAGLLSLPVPPSSIIAAVLDDRPRSAILLCLRPLRAPPSSAAI
jgi:hypothetical protein